VTTTAADARYETARAIAANLPGATARNMPALDFASVKWFPPAGGEVTVWVKRTGLTESAIDVEMHGLSADTVTAAVQAIASVQATQRQAVPA